MENFRMDRTVCKAQSFAEADKANVFGKDVSLADRIKMSFHLTCTIFGLKEGDSLKLDKKIFSAHKLSDAQHIRI
ncbi:MAG: hypothetical protein H7334_10370 [Ferruginibacter sp.]|nr:hypothetical protein [Ferruginibacter sp.]